jgi:hypothetical protein
MKGIFLTSALAVVLATPARPAQAQSLGSLTENGVSMEVKAVVAVLDPAKPEVAFHLLPFQPSADEIAKLQADDGMWLLDKPSPDPKKWKNCPFGTFKLGWPFDKEAVGDPKKATFYIYGFGVGAPGSNLNFSTFGDQTDTTLTGAVKAGEEMTVTTKGVQDVANTKLAWDLRLRAKLLPLKKKS